VTKISGYAALATAADNDLIPVVDVSDTSMSASGTTKNATVKAVLAGAARGVNLPAYGVDLTGAADSTTQLNNALAAGPVDLPMYATIKARGQINVPAGGVLTTGGRNQPIYAGGGAVIKPDGAFSGTALIAPGNGAYIGGLGLDLSAAPAGVKGIVGGTAANVTLEKLYVYHATGVAVDVSAGAHGWWGSWIKIDGGSDVGLAEAGHYDGHWAHVHVIGTAGHCVSIAGAIPNSIHEDLRAEWCGQGKDGIHISGAWNSGTGSGPALFIGARTDRNDNHGVSIAATGTVPLIFEGASLRRDGRNSAAGGSMGGGNFGGLAMFSATVPVIFNGLTVFPGVDDDGTKTNSPSWSVWLSGTNSYLALNGAFLHGQSAANGLFAVTTATTVGGTTPTKYLIRGVAYRTGSTSAPTAIAYLTDQQA
jgi:hypothetical protein